MSRTHRPDRARILSSWNGRFDELSSGQQSSSWLPAVIWQRPAHSENFSQRYVALSRTRTRSRDGTGPVTSIVKLRRAILRINRVRAPQPQRLRTSKMSVWRRRPRARTSKKLTCHMELACPGKNG